MLTIKTGQAEVLCSPSAPQFLQTDLVSTEAGVGGLS